MVGLLWLAVLGVPATLAILTFKTWKGALAKEHRSPRRVAIVAVSAIVALVAGFFFARFTRHTEGGSVIGLPIPWGGFERSLSTGRRMDFISPLSPFVWLLDLIFWVGLGHVPVWLHLLRRRRKLGNAQQQRGAG